MMLLINQLSNINSWCPNLQDICLDSLTLADLPQGATQSCLAALPKIRSLNVEDIEATTQDVLPLLSGEWISNIQALFVELRIMDVPAIVISLTPYLKKAKTIELYGENNDNHADDSTFQLLSVHCPKLEQFRCNLNVESITDAALIALGTGCPNLQRAYFDRCPHVTDAGLVALVTGCPKLENIDLLECRNFTSAGWLALAENCSGLKRLNIIGNYNIKEQDIIAIAEHCPQLVFLRVSHHCATNAVLIALGKNCLALETLDVAGPCCEIGITALAKGCTKLKYLYLYDCNAITDAAIESVLKHCLLLEDLNLPSSSHKLSQALKERLYNMIQTKQLHHLWL